MRSSSLVAALIPWAVATSACAQERPVATITLTEGGIPHVVAADMSALGFGAGYAAALTDLCGVADAIATYTGRRSIAFGAEARTQLHIPLRSQVDNALNDLTVRFSVDDDLVQRARRSMSSDMRAMIRGYADGYNKRIREVPPEGRPLACRARGAVVQIAADDLIRRNLAFAMTLGQRFFLRELYAAAPPAAHEREALPNPPGALPRPIGPASNAYAFGRDITTNGAGLLLANPHYVWEGPERFMQMHLTAPGYDVMGIATLGSPIIAIGFNRTLAWTHTVSTDLKATLYRLQLDPADPTRYLLDGRSRRMEQRRVAVPARDSAGRTKTLSHTFWVTQFGPVVEGEGLPWSQTEAYAVSDPNYGNVAMLDQSLDIGRANDVRTLQARLAARMALPFLNTIAADAAGDVIYADLSVTPDFDAAQLRNCGVVAPGAAAYFIANVMDGSRSACTRATREGVPRPGILPAAAKPSLVRSDYVANSNDSYWLANLDAPLVGFAPVIGGERQQLSARGRLGLEQVRRRRDGTDGLGAPGMDRERLKAILFSNRNFMAELLLDDLVAMCRRQPRASLEAGAVYDLTPACDVLEQWDRRDDLASVGALLFRGFLGRISYYGPGAATFWREPFDPARPIETPRGIRADNANVLPALAAAANAIELSGMSIRAALGDVQFVQRGGMRIPIHGGLDSSVYNVMDMTLQPGVGYTDPVLSGATYIAVVGFEGGKPVADAILATGQTSDAASALSWEGTVAYSEKRWTRLPFTPQEVAARAIAPAIELRR